MYFIDLDRDFIMNNSVPNNDYYEYCLGNQVEITGIKTKNANDLMARNLSAKFFEDKFMLKYQPTNKVLFSKTLLESQSEENFTSFSIDEKSGSIIIGTPAEFKAQDGVLVFSGFLSLNNLVEQDRLIYGNAKNESTIKKKVRVLSVGVLGNMLYALYYVPSSKGLAIGVKGDSCTIGISPTTLKTLDCSNFKGFSIKDWFENTKIKEI